MENKIATSMNTNEISAATMQSVVSGIEGIVEKSVDVSRDTELIMAMTPKDGYDLKLQLIEKAEDMSTLEKLSAIDTADDKYHQNLTHSYELYSDERQSKVVTVLTCTAVLALLIVFPNGRKIASGVAKLVA